MNKANCICYLKDFLSALRDVARSGEDERQRADGFRHHSDGHFESGIAHRLSRHTRIAVIVRRPYMLIQPQNERGKKTI